MAQNTRIFNPFGVLIKNGGLYFNLHTDIEDEFDDSEYVIIRLKDLDRESSHKLSILLQGKFHKGING